MAKGETKVASMVVLMVLTFLISWLPYASLAMVVVSNPDVKIHPLVGTVPVYLAKSSTVYNPIIYIYLNKQVLGQHLQILTDDTLLYNFEEIFSSIFSPVFMAICFQF